MTKTSLAAYRTAHKVNRFVISPSFKKGDFKSHAVDCPFVFFHEDRYFMTYVGWDGDGYRTGLASSLDLEHWHDEGLLIDRGPEGSTTHYNVALTSILRDNELFGPATLKKVNDRYVGTYHAYPRPGYEEGPAVIGLCYSQDLRHWQIEEPVLRPDPDCAWEAAGLYKSWLLEHAGTYYLFYNAKNRPVYVWNEQIGVATSNDLVHWQRSSLNPLVTIGNPGEFDDLFAADPAVYRDQDRWVMFYFGNCSDGHARDGLAISDNLLHWEKGGEILLDVGPEGSIDSKYAAKPSMISRDGRLFHFYCGVSAAFGMETGEVEVEEHRGISYAVSDHPAPGAQRTRS